MAGLGQWRKQPMGALHRGLEIHLLQIALDAVVSSGEVQQLFRGALQPLRLGADVGDELPHGGAVHLRVLHNAVGQQTDGGQRRFQLVAGVRDEPAALGLGGLQPLGQIVQLAAQLRQLVVAAELQTEGVVAGLHRAHAVGQLGDASCHHSKGKEDDHQRQQRDRNRDGAQSVLDAHDDGGLLRVVLRDVHRADGLAAAAHRNCGSAGEGIHIEL